MCGRDSDQTSIFLQTFAHGSLGANPWSSSLFENESNRLKKGFRPQQKGVFISPDLSITKDHG